MVTMSTRCAAEDGLRGAVLRVDAPACAARLRTVRSRHLDQGAAVPCELVAELLDEHAPSSVQDASREAPACLDHIAYLETLYDDDAVTLGVAGAELMNEVRALSSNLAVQDRDAKLRLVAILGSLLLARDVALRTSETTERLAVVTGSLDDASVAIGHRVDHAAVEGDNRTGAAGYRRSVSCSVVAR